MRDNYQPSIFDGTEESILNKSIKLIKSFEDAAIYRNPIGYAVAYSGGKDSDALLQLFKMAGVRFFVFHNHTTLDAPETVYYIRKKFYELELAGIPCKIYKPEINFWALCRHKHTLPSRLMRFCCSYLKERDIPEIKYACRSFGVRKAESVKRDLNRDSIELHNRADYSDMQKFHFDNGEEVRQTDACYTKHYFVINPIAYWTDNYLWEFLRSEHIEVNPLYTEGFNRIGCIGCPMAGKHRIEEFKRYPAFERIFITLCDKLVEDNKKRVEGGVEFKRSWATGREYFEWWLQG